MLLLLWSITDVPVTCAGAKEPHHDDDDGGGGDGGGDDDDKKDTKIYICLALLSKDTNIIP